MKRFMVLTFLLLLLSGCGNDESKEFSGESDNWKFTYYSNELGTEDSHNIAKIEYIGTGLKPKEVMFDFGQGEDGESFGAISQLQEDGTYKETDYGTCKTCTILNENQEVSGVIEWDGQKENLILTSK